MPAMILQFLASKLGGWAVSGLILLVAGIGYGIEQNRIHSRDNTLAADAINLQKAANANKGLADQVTSLTADKAEADKKARDAEKALQVEMGRESQNVALVEKKIDEDATKSDDVCSRALADALGLRCPASSDNHAAAKN